jgi:predicted Co/Zn/Cd cation transporter (cation efflux family)
MIAAAARIGIKPAEFWDMTPAELEACADGYMESYVDSYRQIIEHAWYVAVLGRAKKIPNINTLTKSIKTKKEKQKKQSAEEIYGALIGAFGGPK